MDEIPIAPLPGRSKPTGTPSAKPASGSEPNEPRRDFVTQAVTVAVSSVLVVPPVVAGIGTLLDPVLRGGQGHQFLRVAALSAVPDDGVPRSFPVIADRVDAWTTQANQPVGRVFLRRLPGTETIEAVSATCPHAGCLVDFRPERKQFQCPCHTSAFEADGARVPPCPSPRDLDRLACEVRGDGDQRSIFVEYVNYYSGLAEKKPKA